MSSAQEGAQAAYDSIIQYVKRYYKKIESIIIVDTYGDYAKINNN